MYENQPPKLVRTEAPRFMQPVQYRWYPVSLRYYFSDDEPLTFSVTSSDSSIVAVGINSHRRGFRGWIYARNEIDHRPDNDGTAIASLIATDPGGLSDTLEVKVTVSHTLILRDDFESNEHVSEQWGVWELTRATATVESGMLRLTLPRKNGGGIFHIPDYPRDRYPRMAHWRVSTRMGNLSRDGWAQLIIRTRQRSYSRPPQFYLQIGADPERRWTEDDTNWRLIVPTADDDHRNWLVASGESEAVGGLGELVDVTLSHNGETLWVAIGDMVVFTTTEFGNSKDYDFFYTALSNWPMTPDLEIERTSIFDWIEIWGHSHPLTEGIK